MTALEVLERPKRPMKRREYHGLRRASEYKCWAAIVQRCTNQNNPSYPRYGGAGISVYQPWRESFAAFLRHIGRRPSPKHSVDRIDNSRGYEPGNVRWATPIEQAQNQRKTTWISAFGKRLCLSEWARVSGIPSVTLFCRLNRGWPPEKALSEPAYKGKLTDADAAEMRRLRATGLSGAAIARLFGVDTSTACRAIKGVYHKPAFDAAMSLALDGADCGDVP